MIALLLAVILLPLALAVLVLTLVMAVMNPLVTLVVVALVLGPTSYALWRVFQTNRLRNGLLRVELERRKKFSRTSEPF